MDLIDRIFLTTSANSVIGKSVSFFRLEIMYGGDDHYIFEMFVHLMVKLKEQAWLMLDESEDSKS